MPDTNTPAEELRGILLDLIRHYVGVVIPTDGSTPYKIDDDFTGMGIDKAKAAIQAHILGVLETVEQDVIGEREPRKSVVCGCLKDSKTGHRVTVEPSIDRNNLRATQRTALEKIKAKYGGGGL